MSELRIMIVDDDGGLLEDIEESAASEDYKSYGAVISRVGSPDEMFGRLEDDASNPGKLPNIIFLDIKFGAEDQSGLGLSALRRLKLHRRLAIKMIPVVMYTTSTDPKDINESYKNRVNEYVPKQHDQIEQFWRAVSYWSTTSIYPKQQ